VFGEGSTGASNDLTSATDLATRMVREFGLSPALGPVGYADAAASSSGNPFAGQPYSESTQSVIDSEVARLLREAEKTTIDLLTQHRAALDRLADALLHHETVDGKTVTAIAAATR
jgi:cell division protease FtsH